MTISGFEVLKAVFAVDTPAFAVVLLLVKGTLMLLAALAVSRLMQPASAGARHLVWLVALGGLLALPFLAAWGPLPVPVLPEVAAPRSAPAPATGAPIAAAEAATQNAAPPAPSTLRNSEPVPAGQSTPSLSAMIEGLWAVVALALVGQLLYGAWSVRRILSRARPLEEPDWQTPLYEIADRLELPSAPRLLRSEDVKMPFAAGLFSSTIVLPAESDVWSADRRSAVLIHELGHVRRRDLIGHTLGRVACALYWFHPLVWTASRRLRAESERACDDLALVFGARPSDYAEHLLDIVSCVRDHNTPAVALAMAHRREFEGRMLAILNPELRRRAPSRVESAALVGALAVIAVLVGAAAPVPRPAQSAGRRAQSGADTAMILRDTAPRGAVALPVQPRVSRRAAAPAPLTSPSPQEDGPGDDRAAVLAKTLRTDSSAHVRRVAAWGLRRYADTDVGLPALSSAVGSDADAAVREMAAWALSQARRNATASATLVKALKDKDPEVRGTSVWSLGSVGDEASVEALAGMLGDSDAEVRETAAWSIGSCHPDQAPAALINALADKDKDVRLSVAWALYRIEDPGATDAIDAAFKRETDPEVQRGLIRALGAMGDRSVDALQRLVSSPSAEIREVAVRALAGGSATGPWPWPRPRPRPFP